MCGKNSDNFISPFDTPKKFTSDTNLAMLELYARSDKVEIELYYRYVTSETDPLKDTCFPRKY